MYYKQAEPVEDWSQPTKESKTEFAIRNTGSNDSRPSLSNTIDDIINDDDAEIQSIIDVSRFVK